MDALSCCPSFTAAQTNRPPTTTAGRRTTRTRTIAAAISIQESFPTRYSLKSACARPVSIPHGPAERLVMDASNARKVRWATDLAAAWSVALHLTHARSLPLGYCTAEGAPGCRRSTPDRLSRATRLSEYG